ncbi:glycosyltransferase family 4 protein [Pseudothermotoga sp.]|uniref:glycosyltransferase family 4 protein n=1 Tax=Pseudothermotoga sp. TaxID=2033661 RepID=UPI0029949E6C|nr:glycosyltransferase family 4 protein [Pseudothermotoga sp.]MCX7812485.1 glycosyltransferase family 4 protein [Pseudothermotoga sp.]MDW8140061.1 glycosyltransferase family 4 protein [Pseudothermotoga sp.]
MKVLLYAEAKRLLSRSGIGIALKHQMEALKRVNVDFTLAIDDDYDLAHINTVGPGARFVANSCRSKNIPIIWHVHTTAEDIRNSFLLSNIYSKYAKFALRKIYSKADFLVFPTRYTMNIVRKYGVKVEGEVVSNGVDTQFFKKNEEKARQFRRKYGLTGPIVLCVALPFKRKGIHDFVDVAKRLSQCHFVWIGSKGLASLLPRDVREILRNPPSNVLFPGFMPQEELVGAYSAADVFFFPSYEENEGIVVLEALSCECPVLVRDIPVYEDWLQDGVNCLKGKTNTDFEKAIEKLISDKNFANELGKMARKVALERDLTIIGEKLKRIYEEVLEKHGKKDE